MNEANAHNPDLVQLCSACQQRAATVYRTVVVHHKPAETVPLCEHCAPRAPAETGNLQIPKKLSVLGSKCSFCGGKAVSGTIQKEATTVFWCATCGRAYQQISKRLWEAEHSNINDCSNPEGLHELISSGQIDAWVSSIHEKTVQIMKHETGLQDQSPH